MKLRPYQEDSINRTRDALTRVRSVLQQAPTGAGKTAMAASMSARAANRDKRIYFACHRAELILQTSQAFRKVGIKHGFIAQGWPQRPELDAQICSIQTLSRRLDTIPEPDLLIVDECHHVAAKSWARVVERWNRSYVVGLSATPIRLDGKGLGDWFQELVPGPTVAELMDAGFLSRYRLFAPSTPDTTGVQRRAGDFKREQLGQAVNKPKLVGDIVTHWKRYADGMKTIVFCVSIEHSEATAAAFNAAGIPAAHIDGKTPGPVRAAALRKLARGSLQVVTNVELFGEGFDLSANAGIDCTVECVISARPTQSLSIWLQQVGRALRPKPHPAIILDHGGNAMRHGIPDEDRIWTLETSKKKSRDQVAPVRQCPRCFAVHSAAISRCVECAYEYPVQSREIESVDGNLEEIDVVALRAKRKTENRSARTLDELIELGIARGYQYPRQWAKRLIEARERGQSRRRGAA